MVLWLGAVPYREAWDLQQRLVQARQQELVGDMLVLLEHPHVYTLGRRATLDHLLADSTTLERLGAAAYRVDRGGDITYHGPGQLVGYPVLDLRQRRLDVHGYLRHIEEALIRALARFGIAAGRDPQHTGVWVVREKIAAIGVKVSRGVTSHGFALNLCPDLSYFSHIVPCGIADRRVTSIERLLGARLRGETVREVVAAEWATVFGGEWQAAEPAGLLSRLPARHEGGADPPAPVFEALSVLT